MIEMTTTTTVNFVCITPTTLAAVDASKVSVIAFGTQ
jgi:hypothetical protein